MYLLVLLDEVPDEKTFKLKFSITILLNYTTLYNMLRVFQLFE